MPVKVNKIQINKNINDLCLISNRPDICHEWVTRLKQMGIEPYSVISKSKSNEEESKVDKNSNYYKKKQGLDDQNFIILTPISITKAKRKYNNVKCILDPDYGDYMIIADKINQYSNNEIEVQFIAEKSKQKFVSLQEMNRMPKEKLIKLVGSEKVFDVPKKFRDIMLKAFADRSKKKRFFAVYLMKELK